jgi:hypothetical protein
LRGPNRAFQPRLIDRCGVRGAINCLDARKVLLTKKLYHPSRPDEPRAERFSLLAARGCIPDGSLARAKDDSFDPYKIGRKIRD